MSLPNHDRSHGVGVANRPHLQLRAGQTWDAWNDMVTGRAFRPGDESLLSLLTIVNLRLKTILANVPDVDTGFGDVTTEAIARLCGRTGSVAGLHWNPPFHVMTVSCSSSGWLLISVGFNRAI